MSRYLMIAAVLLLMAATTAGFLYAGQRAPAPADPAADGPAITVHKTPWCGCCSDWVDHLREHGLAVTVEEHDDLTATRTGLDVPPRLASCHTAEVAGYAIEGHVPAAEIRRLLSERPAGAQGLAVPGMPAGSPGMEMPGREDDYAVVAFGRDGMRTYAEYRGAERR